MKFPTFSMCVQCTFGIRFDFSSVFCLSLLVSECVCKLQLQNLLAFVLVSVFLYLFKSESFTIDVVCYRFTAWQLVWKRVRACNVYMIT